MTSRRNSPSGLVFSYCTVRGDGTSTAYLRKSGSLRSLRNKPPLACGLALMRRLPRGASAFSSGTQPCRRRQTAPRARSSASSPRAASGWPGSRARPAKGTWCDRHEPSTLWPLISSGPVHPLGDRSTIIGQRGRNAGVRLARRLAGTRGFRRSPAPAWPPSPGACARDRRPRRSTACSRSRRTAPRAPRG